MAADCGAMYCTSLCSIPSPVLSSTANVLVCSIPRRSCVSFMFCVSMEYLFCFYCHLPQVLFNGRKYLLLSPCPISLSNWINHLGILCTWMSIFHIYDWWWDKFRYTWSTRSSKKVDWSTTVLDDIKFGPGNRPYWETKEGRAQPRYSNLLQTLSKEQNPSQRRLLFESHRCKMGGIIGVPGRQIEPRWVGFSRQ